MLGSHRLKIGNAIRIARRITPRWLMSRKFPPRRGTSAPKLGQRIADLVHRGII